MPRTEAPQSSVAKFLETVGKKHEAVEYLRDRFPGIFEAPNSIRTALVEASIIKELDVEPLVEPNFARTLLIDHDVKISAIANRFAVIGGERRTRLDFEDRRGRTTKITATISSIDPDFTPIEVGFYDRGIFSGIFYYPETRLLDVRGYGYENRFDGFENKCRNLPYESPFIRTITSVKGLLIINHSFPDRTNSGVFIIPTSLFLPEGR